MTQIGMFLAALEDLVLLVSLTLWMTQCHFWIGKPWAIEWVHRPCSTSLLLHCTGCGCSKNRSCPEKELSMLLHWILMCPHWYIRIQCQRKYSDWGSCWWEGFPLAWLAECSAPWPAWPWISKSPLQWPSSASSPTPCTKWSKVRCTTLEGFQAGWNNPWARWPWAKGQSAMAAVQICVTDVASLELADFEAELFWAWIILRMGNFEAE